MLGHRRRRRRINLADVVLALIVFWTALSLATVLIAPVFPASAKKPKPGGPPPHIPSLTPTPGGSAPTATPTTGQATAGPDPTATPTSQGVITAAPATQPAPEVTGTPSR